MLVLGHQCLTALCRGKSCFMSMYFPFESMSRAISGPSVLVGAVLVGAGLLVLLTNRREKPISHQKKRTSAC